MPELQAGGCPVVFSDIRTLPEINNNEVGWVIEVSKNNLGEGCYLTAANRASMSQKCEAGLFTVLRAILQARNAIAVQAASQVNQVKKATIRKMLKKR